jgi:hypothetical protein
MIVEGRLGGKLSARVRRSVNEVLDGRISLDWTAWTATVRDTAPAVREQPSHDATHTTMAGPHSRHVRATLLVRYSF